MDENNQINYEPTYTEKDFLFVKDMLAQYWKNIAISIFQWKRRNGQPLSTISKGLTSELLETYLYEYGLSVFFADKSYGFLALKAVPVAERNVYFKPVKVRAIGFNYNKEVDLDKGVLIKNNNLAKPTKLFIDYYCSKLADIELTKDLNRNAQKTPFILECTEATVLTAKNIFKKLHTGEPVLYKNKTRGEADVGITVQTPNVPFICDQLEDEYNAYVAKILTLLGLDNYVEDKAERVQSAEVESQQEYIISSFKSMLDQRQQACDRINEMFGLDLYIDYVKGEEIESTDADKTDEQEGENNE